MKLIFILFFSIINSFSQDKELFVDYNFSFHTGYYGEEKLALIANDNYVLSKVTGYHKIIKTIGEESKASNKEFNIYLFQDRKNHNITYEHLFNVNQKVLVKEDLNLFTWKLTTESKTILGYTCTKATTTYRGRDYIAYFTTEIPFKAAPWKFHGLPGVLLEVHSTDDLFKISAQNLAIQKATNKLTNPFLNNSNVLTWDEFVIEYTKRLKKAMDKEQAMLVRLGYHKKGNLNSGFVPNIELISEYNLPYDQREQFKLKNK